MSYRGNGKLGDAEAPDAVEDSAKRGDPVSPLLEFQGTPLRSTCCVASNYSQDTSEQWQFCARCFAVTACCPAG